MIDTADVKGRPDPEEEEKELARPYSIAKNEGISLIRSNSSPKAEKRERSTLSLKSQKKVANFYVYNDLIAPKLDTKPFVLPPRRQAAIPDNNGE